LRVAQSGNDLLTVSRERSGQFRKAPSGTRSFEKATFIKHVIEAFTYPFVSAIDMMMSRANGIHQGCDRGHS
jgi:hypothetical protein